MSHKKDKIVYVVHCVDTEGPLSESLVDIFTRIKYVFGVSLRASIQNLCKLQHGQLDLGKNTEAIKRLVDPKLIAYNENFKDIGRMLDRITNPTFRCKFPDSLGNGWVYNWFCVDHVGYNYNPRKRVLGHHKIFDYYTNLLKKKENRSDKIFFHYHPLPYNRMAHSCATFYLNDNHIFEILARKIIDKQWFPTVFRPGFHSTRPDSNWFLEQWIPFDYANQSTTQDIIQPDLANGRFGDWRRAPRIWGAYHPHHDDYQRVGCCRRWIFRCLNMEARLRKLTLEDVEEAFLQAADTGKAVLSFTNHDYRDMASEVADVSGMIERVSRKWGGITFKYTNALEAARAYINAPTPEKIGLQFSFKPSCGKMSGDVIRVRASGELFSPQPFLAIKDVKGNYYYDNFDCAWARNEWSYVLDWQTLPLEKIAKIGVAAVGKQGQSEIVVYDFKSKRLSQKISNY